MSVLSNPFLWLAVVLIATAVLVKRMRIRWLVESWVGGERDRSWAVRGLSYPGALSRAQALRRELEHEYDERGVVDYEIAIFNHKTNQLLAYVSPEGRESREPEPSEP